MALLGGAGGSDASLDPSELAAISDGLLLLIDQLNTASSSSGSASAPPLVPEVLALVADLVDDLAEVLSNPTAAPDSLQLLVTNLAANLQAIPASLLGLGGSGIPGAGGDNPLAGLPVLGDIFNALQGATGGSQGSSANNPLDGTPLAPLGVVLAPLFSLLPL
jgi:hypothetical protein